MGQGEDRANWYAGIAIVGRIPGSKAHNAIVDHCVGDEKPWLVIHPGFSDGEIGAGTLIALNDRVMIIKTGGVAGLMSGATFGGRFSTFAYSDITSIEYNSGMVNGVLEILTASYQGTENKDYWSVWGSNPNKSNKNPFALSNTLPLPKALYKSGLAHINELRARVSSAKKTGVTVSAPATSDVAQQLRQLSELHESGVLTPEEFAAAKAAVINSSQK